MEVKHELRLVRSVVRIKIGMSTLPSVVRKKVSEEAELERKRRRKNRGLLVILSSSLPLSCQSEARGRCHSIFKDLASIQYCN